MSLFNAMSFYSLRFTELAIFEQYQLMSIGRIVFAYVQVIFIDPVLNKT